MGFFSLFKRSKIPVETPVCVTSNTTDNPNISDSRNAREAYLQQITEKVTSDLLALPTYEIELSQSTLKRQLVSDLNEVKYSNITAKGKYPNFVAFDVETTGLSAGKDRIIQLSAIRFVDGKATEKFDTFVNPQKPIPPEITKINGITDDMVKGSPTIHEILPAFDRFIGKSDLVSHNMDFDLKFIHVNGSQVITGKRRYFCTLLQSQKMLKKPKQKWDKEFQEYVTDWDQDYDVYDHKLDTLCDYFHIILPKAHNSLYDAYAAGELFLKLIEEKQLY